LIEIIVCFIFDLIFMSLQIPLNKLSIILKSINYSLPSLDGNKVATGISTDTRELQKGDVFIALKGENFDGHNFISQAINLGASAIVISDLAMFNSSLNILCFYVEDTLVAYQNLAHWWRKQLQIPIIGITGSVGKTTTKELISAVLTTQGRVLKTVANYNNEIGVPKTLLSISPDDDFAVIEMAMRARGEIALLTQITEPTIGVITNVGTAHIGRLGSEEAIAEAKCELLANISPDSIAVLNHDNPLLIKTAAKYWSGKTITYGLEGGDLRGEIIDSETMKVEGINFKLPLPGRHNALNYLAALAIAQILKIDLESLAQGVNITMPEGRSQRYTIGKDIVILDETYNAGKESMVAALQLLKDTQGKRKIAVLGTMKELGERAAKLHFEVGETFKNMGLDRLFVLVDEPETEKIAEGAGHINTECFSTHDQLIQRLKEVVQEGDRLLFKASHSVGLNKVVQAMIKQ
jgi:UDP-N-acetylmuramoyl-tripeptide--D-alanyl-D-alanine ligase